MSPRVASATATRVLTQLRRDPQTLALVLVAPCVIVALAEYLLDDQPATFDRIGGPMLGLFPFIQMFLITSIAVLRERTSGTLEPLLCGLLIPRDQMAPALQTLADALPLTYALDALDRVARGDGLSDRSRSTSPSSPPSPRRPGPRRHDPATSHPLTAARGQQASPYARSGRAVEDECHQRFGRQRRGVRERGGCGDGGVEDPGGGSGGQVTEALHAGEDTEGRAAAGRRG
jgi:hypothetical protein